VAVEQHVKVQEAVAILPGSEWWSSKRTGRAGGIGRESSLNKQDMGKLKAELQSSHQKMTDLIR